MSGSTSPPRGSPYNPQQCDHETLMCLVGAVAEPSRSLSRPSFVLVGAHHWETPGSLPLNLSERFMSLAEWRDRVLTRNERRVARPVEIAAAMRRGKLREMRCLWTQRIAQTGFARRGSGCAGSPETAIWTVEGEEADEEDNTLLERAIFLQITRAIEEMGRQFGETMDQVQLQEDLSEPSMDDAATVMPLQTGETVTEADSAVDNMIRQVEAVIKDFEAVIGGAGVVVVEARQERRMLRKLHQALKVMGRDLAKKIGEDEHDSSGSESDQSVGESEAEDVLPKPQPQMYGLYADRKTTAPPRIPLDNPVPANAEQYHKCDCSKQTRAAKCIYCDDDAVFDGVYDNLI